MLRIFLVSLLLANSTARGKTLKVIVDPGHGGADTGAVREGYKESELVLNICNYLINMLSSNRDFAVHTTRSTDQLVPLEERTRFAEGKNADVFISVHANSSPVASTKGVEIYFKNQLPADVESQYLANRENEGLSHVHGEKPKGDLAVIIDDLHRQNQIYMSFNLAKEVHQVWSRYQKSHLHIRQAPFHVLSEIKMPSILIETGFITNPQETQRLNDPKYQKKIAEIIFEGLQRYRQKWLSTL